MTPHRRHHHHPQPGGQGRNVTTCRSAADVLFLAHHVLIQVRPTTAEFTSRRRVSPPQKILQTDPSNHLKLCRKWLDATDQISRIGLCIWHCIEHTQNCPPHSCLYVLRVRQKAEVHQRKENPNPMYASWDTLKFCLQYKWPLAGERRKLGLLAQWECRGSQV